ncbi:MAG TPA: F0F1 ATP synthase subunit A [Candidatus Saccharimonadales bacterium]|nr:F0F1 ATP synthase subunit A [Candidatus Saccharimonadales bacterium]
MMGMLGVFAAESGPAVHVAPAPDFTVAGIPVTNSMVWGWIVSLIIIVTLIMVARKVTVWPKGGLIQYVEAGVTFVSDLVTGAFTEKSIGRKYVPFFVTLFFLVLLNNWSGLIPGVGDGLQVDGHPVFRPITADLNFTLVMGLITMIFVYTASIREVGGIRKYIRHFFIGSPLNPLYLTIGLIEMLTDLTRALSLALRLFLNVTIGEIVIAVFAYLGSLLGPSLILSPITSLPFTLLELGVGALQAYIFVILGVNYLAISVNSAHSHESLTDNDSPETIGAATPEGAKG